MITKIGDTTLEWHGEKIKKESNSQIAKAMLQIGLLVQASATYRAPVDLGNLKNSIQIEAEAREVTIGTNVEYAPYLEFGTGIYAEKGDGRKTPWMYFNRKLNTYLWTRGNKPQPFLRPALDENVERIKTLIANALNSAFRQGGGK